MSSERQSDVPPSNNEGQNEDSTMSDVPNLPFDQDDAYFLELIDMEVDRVLADITTQPSEVQDNALATTTQPSEVQDNAAGPSQSADDLNSDVNFALASLQVTSNTNIQASAPKFRSGVLTTTRTLLSEQIDREKISYRFAPEPFKLNCIWTKDSDWTRALGASKASDIIPVSVLIGVDSGKFNACPKLTLTFDYIRDHASRKEHEGRIKKRMAPRTYGVRISVQPGVSTVAYQFDSSHDGSSSSEKPWEIKSLTFTKLSELDSHTDRDTINAAQKYFTSDADTNIWVIKLSTEGGLFDRVWEDVEATSIDTRLKGVLTELRSSPQTDHIIIFQDKKKIDLAFVFDWWTMLVHDRVPPQAHVIDAASGEVAVGLDSEGVAEIGNHIYARYNPEVEQALQDSFYERDAVNHPVKFPYMPGRIHQVESEIYFPDPRDLEARLKIGIVHEQQFVAFRVMEYQRHTARVLVVKAMDWTPGQLNSEAMMGARNSYYVLVMSIDALPRALNDGEIDDVDEMVPPPERTSFSLNPVTDPARLESDAPGKNWRGYVFNHPSSILKEMGVKFCIFATKPPGGAHFQGRIYQTLEAARDDYNHKARRAEASGRRSRLPTMGLDPKINVVTEERELAAITKVCNLDYTRLRHIQMPLLFAYERKQPEPFDVVNQNGISPEEADVLNYRWDLLRQIIDSNLNLKDNLGHQQLIDSLRNMPGAITLVTGPAGAGKTMLTAHMAVILVLLGYRITLQAREHDAVDNMAFEFDKACDNIMEWLLEFKETEIAAEVAGMWVLRHDTSALLDMDALPSQDLKKGTIFETKEADHASYMKTPAYIDESQFLGEMEIATVDQGATAAAEERQVVIDFLRGRQAAMKTLQEAKLVKQKSKQLRYPGHMSMAANLQRYRSKMRPDDKTSAEFFDLRDRASAGEALTHEHQERMKELQRGLHIQIARNADVVICTVAAGADDVIKATPDFDFGFFDEAGKMSIPTGILALSSIKQHAFFLGDPRQIGVQLASSNFNAMSRQLSRSILTWFEEKGVHSIMMVKQYRCAPSVFNFINNCFYEQKVENDPITESEEIERSPLRIACRDFAKSRGAMDTTDKQHTKGSLLMGLNVRCGIAVREKGGVSRVNYGECEAALQTARDLIARPGIQPSDILIMSFYRGSIDVLLELQSAYQDTKGVEFKTVDACQGRSVKISIVVLGATNHGKALDLFGKNNPIQKDFMWRLTPYVLSPERLNVSLSRSSNLVVFIANWGTLTTIEPEGRIASNSGASLKQLAAYLVAYKLVVDSDVIDQNPRLGLTPGSKLEADFQTALAYKTIKRSGWFGGKFKETRAICEVEQRRGKRAPMPQIMGTTNAFVESIPGALNQESAERQSKGVYPARRPRKSGKDKANKRDLEEGEVPQVDNRKVLTEAAKRAHDQSTGAPTKKHKGGKS